MNTIVKRTDTTYGGYDFIEYNTVSKKFHTGNSRAFRGHYLGDDITINVKTARELKVVKDQLEQMGFTETSIEN